MNDSSFKLTVLDLLTLVSAILLGLAFWLFPWITSEETLSSGLDVMNATPIGATLDALIYAIPIASIAGVILTIIGVFAKPIRMIAIGLIALLSAISTLYFFNFFWTQNNAIIDIDIQLGLGFWFSYFTSIILVYQVLISRDDEDLSLVDLTIDLLRVLIIVIVITGSANTILSGKFTLENYIALFIAGLAQGSIYALIALGYTLVYGILLMINFAHGEVFMAGAFTTMFLARWLDQIGFLNTYPIISVLIMIVFSGFISMVIAIILERVAYRPLRGSPRLVPLITAIGASFFLQYTFAGLYGSGNFAYPNIDAFSGTINFLGFVEIPQAQLIVFFSALGIMAALYWLVERTKFGKAMRAVSEDKEVAKLMGIDINFIILFTFAVGGALAGAAGVINGIFRPQGVKFTMGFIPGIKAFTAAVLGGIGNVPGAMIGGLFLGVIEAMGPNLVLAGMGIPSANQLKDVIAFTMLVLVLIFRPQGILGERLTEKKA
ncbi:MAG: branched-chain amino acid ABC transporter permease [Chloroflexota bacterium]